MMGTPSVAWEPFPCFGTAERFLLLTSQGVKFKTFAHGVSFEGDRVGLGPCRSRMPSARVGSPMRSSQRSMGYRLVTRVERFSHRSSRISRRSWRWSRGEWQQTQVVQDKKIHFRRGPGSLSGLPGQGDLEEKPRGAQKEFINKSG